MKGIYSYRLQGRVNVYTYVDLRIIKYTRKHGKLLVRAPDRILLNLNPYSDLIFIY